MQSNRQIQRSNFFKRTTRLASLCLLFICFSANNLASEEMHVIQLSGSGELTLVPDTASITLGVNVRGDELSALQTATDSAVSNILARLRALGIEDKNLAATYIRISPRYRYDKAQQQSVANGYEVSRDINVTVHDLTLLSQVMSEASSAGINIVSPPQLSSSKREETYLKALDLAVHQATQRAQVLADAANVDLGPVIRMRTQQQSYRPERTPMVMRAMAPDSPEATYQPGELVISASVDIDFAISP